MYRLDAAARKRQKQREKLPQAVKAFLNMHPQPTQGDWWKLAGDLKRFGYYSRTTAEVDIIRTLAGFVDPSRPRFAGIWRFELPSGAEIPRPYAWRD